MNTFFRHCLRLGVLGFVMMSAVAHGQTASLTPSVTVYAAGGGAVTFTATISYATQPTALGYAVDLPDGWSYAGGTNEPSIKPDPGTTGTLEWAYSGGFGTGSSTFTFTVNYPAGLGGDQTIAGSAVYRTPLTNLSLPPVVLTAGTASTAPTITAQPADQTVGMGANVTFSASASGTPMPTLQWQVSKNSGGTWTNVTDASPYSGAMTGTLAIAAVTIGLNGYQYRCVATNSVDSVNSSAATLTVTTQSFGPVATLTTDVTLYATGGGAVTFTATITYATQPTALGFAVGLPAGWSYAGGTNEPSIKPEPGTTGTLEWAYSGGFGTGVSTFAFTATYPAGLSGSQTFTASAVYRTPLANLSVTPLILVAGPATVAPEFTAQPANQSVTAGGNAGFAVAVAGTPTPTLQWQVSANKGVSWADVANASPYSGATTGTLTVTGATAALNGNQYRCVATNNAGAANSAAATLTVIQVAQSINFAALSDKTYGAGTFAVGATATSGLSVAFAVVSGPAAISGGIVTLTGAGSVTLRASQSGDSTYAAAADVERSFTVAKAALMATAASQSRLYGVANPALTVAYAGFVNNDTAASLTSAPTASTTATPASLPGTYPITLTGGSATNYTLTLVNGTLTVTPRDYSGTYFGTFASGGHWALYVRRDNTATYIAYLPTRQSAIVVSLSVNADGTFTVTGTEIKPLTTAVSGYALAMPEAPVTRTASAASAYTLTGQISVNGSVSGALTGLGETLTGAADTGSAQTPALYTASALGTATGSTYTVVGPSGQAFVVTTTPTAVDSATGTVNSSGQLTATTSNNATLTLTINTAAQTVAASVTPAGSSTPVTYAGVPDTVTPIARVVNLSVRTTAGTGDQTLIVGLVITGSGNKTLLLRGIGPTLSTQGVTNPLADPTMRLLNGSGAEISANNDWGGSAQMSANFSSVGAFALPANSKDAALYNTLATGLYSFHTYPNGAGTGIVLAEVYDADDNSTAASVFNISARTQVGTGENILIAGFVITGNSPKTLLIRGLGPTLAAQGVAGALVNPQLYLFGSAGLLANNDDWGGTAALKSAFSATGAGTLVSDTSKDAALLVTLQPGVYSAQVSGVGGTTGVGLVEIFLVP